MQAIIDKVVRVAATDNTGTRNNRLLKMQEELGELTSAYLALTGHKYSDKPYEQISENYREELIDCFLQITELIFVDANMDLEEFEARFSEKLGAWEAKNAKRKMKFGNSWEHGHV